VDILPTLLYLAGLPVPDWCEGKILPGIGGTQGSSGRSIFSVEAKQNSAFQPLGKVTIAMRKDNYKLICYRGYDAEDQFELFDLDDDLEEMDNLYSRLPQVASTLRDELLANLDKSNQIQ
jgi:arylsulfatase A-like enzyme